MELCNILSKAQCEKVLEKYTGNREFSIKRYWINPLQSQLDGLMCEQYFLKIHYQVRDEDKTVQFFFKVLNEANPVMYEITRNIYAFEKESFYYETVVPLLKSKGLSCSYVPKSYFSEPFVIVLEDVAQRSFKCTPKNKPLDLEHCKKCLETLAKFHAEPILYELVTSDELGKIYSFNDEFSEILEDKVFSAEENGATRFMKCSIKGLFFLIDLIPENGISKTDFKTALQAVLDAIMASQENSTGFRSSLLHGDLWSNNFLFRYENNEIADCALVDFQTLKYGPPSLDVLQFVLTNTRKSFREQHQVELLKHYYRCFSSLLMARGFQPEKVLSETEFYKSCKAFTVPAKIHSVVDRCITFLSDDDHQDAAKSEETFANYLFEDRGRYIVRGFEANEAYRELMIEDVTELRDMIFAT
ncbi:uncharacterized protein LOC108909117 [Anoplophora glabripennis]|uniref:uncharacterized protein LOC108909117 n=1 Tax=Anoplophora glabripennis TaxID=217634 RepID=UPI0008743C0F|nr:uncharacterized protein LOC108909117 [Anoplophora glabripennis]